MASPEFAAWCAFMGYAVAERYWAEYEDVWNYYEEALHEYGSEYEFFDEYADAEQYGDEYEYEFPDESADDGSYGDDYEPDADDRDSYSTYADDYGYDYSQKIRGNK